MTGAFDTILIVDWNSGKATGPTPRKVAIWIGAATPRRSEPPVYCASRQEAEHWLLRRLTAERAQNHRVLLGFDFPFAYPAGFAKALTGQDDPLAMAAWLDARITDDAKGQNNRFDVAGEINRRFGGHGPFWGNPLKREITGLPRRKEGYDLAGFPEKRACEAAVPGTFTCWQLAGAGAVGAQVLMGLPLLHRLRQAFGPAVSVWPFEPPEGQIVLAEVWPSLLRRAVQEAANKGEIKDSAQVRLLSQALAQLAPERLEAILQAPLTGPVEEGAILGAGFEEELQGALAQLRPPPLGNDCFALPAGVHWTPVDQALEGLRRALHPVTGTEWIAVQDCAGRITAQEVRAERSNPPLPNTAVDGYGFAHASLPGNGEGPFDLPLAEGRAAAGVLFEGEVPPGAALRVLTGAALPKGVDTVVLEEDVRSTGARIAFRGPIKPGSNTRQAGEDLAAGMPALPEGRRITPADLALLSATAVPQVLCRKRLRVGVLSTGDELVEPGAPAQAGQIYDANRPMLLELLRSWGMEAVDLGRAPDQRDQLKAQLDAAAGRCDAILTSGGASAGDEDHMSALLAETGSLADWRIALKPGRPLALGLWQGTPVFGLPGNPVAALVCTLVFARPALNLLSGAGWTVPQGFWVPAAFSKSKKPGRREYLRARIREGQAEVFKSEGSGRISGLSWAEGLVELPDEAVTVAPGTPVWFVPYALF